MSRFTLIASTGTVATRPSPQTECGIDRRRALALLSSGLAAALSACGKPHEEIVPYADQPVGLVPGTPQRYATAMTLNGYARGVTAIAVDGRPIKLEGSPLHPYSLGSTDVFAEADVLSLYDPERARVVSGPNGPASWEALEAVLMARLKDGGAESGAGMTVLTGRTVSPTELRLIAQLQHAHPAMRWRRFEAVDDDMARAGARLAFGRPMDIIVAVEDAEVLLCLDADPLGPGPEQIRNARGFVARRNPAAQGFSRWYAAESGWSLTGANADHRLPLHPAMIHNLAMRVAGRLGGPAAAVDLPPEAAAFAEACAADLRRAPGRALVLAGRTQPAEVHALAHWMNGVLRAPVTPIACVDPHPEDHGASLAALVEDLNARRVRTLIIIGTNPAYDAPGSLNMAQALGRAQFSLHCTEYENETSRLCTWRAPLSHGLESWADVRARDGTASIVQPLIRPLHDSRTPGQILAMLGGATTPSAYELTRQTWAERAGYPPPEEGAGAEQAAAALDGVPTDARWKAFLTDGVIAGTGSAKAGAPSPAFPHIAPKGTPKGCTLTLSPDPTLFDGRSAGNAWLQECPKPINSEVWGSTVAISPHDARVLGIADLDHLRLTSGSRAVEAPARIVEGQAPGVISGFIGGGRTHAGPIGTAVGQDFAPLRTSQSPWVMAVEVHKGRGHGGPPSFQSLYKVEGEAKTLSPVVSVLDLPGLRARPVESAAAEHPATLLPVHGAEEPGHPPAWAMVIDQASCIGCNACVISCQAENNVPVVGPDEIARGRAMHWLRIDVYDTGGEHESRPTFQPVPCMQCEHAPCEPVCPVEASVHDHEGLNDQVYNRCVGTRFCESNCPYKVRRFNWFGYAHDQAYKTMGDDAYSGQKNPEVTVRARGVMEKCTYCVQRISGARRIAETQGRAIRPDEVVTACQSACPTQAISFGDRNDPGSGLQARREDPRHFALLADLGTRPRTTYLARLRNPNRALRPGSSGVSSP